MQTEDDKMKVAMKGLQETQREMKNLQQRADRLDSKIYSVRNNKEENPIYTKQEVENDITAIRDANLSLKDPVKTKVEKLETVADVAHERARLSVIMNNQGEVVKRLEEKYGVGKGVEVKPATIKQETGKGSNGKVDDIGVASRNYVFPRDKGSKRSTTQTQTPTPQTSSPRPTTSQVSNEKSASLKQSTQQMNDSKTRVATATDVRKGTPNPAKSTTPTPTKVQTQTPPLSTPRAQPIQASNERRTATQPPQQMNDSKTRVATATDVKKGTPNPATSTNAPKTATRVGTPVNNNNDTDKSQTTPKGKNPLREKFTELHNKLNGLKQKTESLIKEGKADGVKEETYKAYQNGLKEIKAAIERRDERLNAHGKIGYEAGGSIGDTVYDTAEKMRDARMAEQTGKVGELESRLNTLTREFQKKAEQEKVEAKQKEKTTPEKTTTTPTPTKVQPQTQTQTPPLSTPRAQPIQASNERRTATQPPQQMNDSKTRVATATDVKKGTPNPATSTTPTPTPSQRSNENETEQIPPSADPKRKRLTESFENLHKRLSEFTRETGEIEKNNKPDGVKEETYKAYIEAIKQFKKDVNDRENRLSEHGVKGYVDGGTIGSTRYEKAEDMRNAQIANQTKRVDELDNRFKQIKTEFEKNVKRDREEAAKEVKTPTPQKQEPETTRTPTPTPPAAEKVEKTPAIPKTASPNLKGLQERVQKLDAEVKQVAGKPNPGVDEQEYKNYSDKIQKLQEDIITRRDKLDVYSTEKYTDGQKFDAEGKTYDKAEDMAKYREAEQTRRVEALEGRLKELQGLEKELENKAKTEKEKVVQIDDDKNPARARVQTENQNPTDPKKGEAPAKPTKDEIDKYRQDLEELILRTNMIRDLSEKGSKREDVKNREEMAQLSKDSEDKTKEMEADKETTFESKDDMDAKLAGHTNDVAELEKRNKLIIQEKVLEKEEIRREDKEVDKERNNEEREEKDTVEKKKGNGSFDITGTAREGGQIDVTGKGNSNGKSESKIEDKWEVRSAYFDKDGKKPLEYKGPYDLESPEHATHLKVRKECSKMYIESLSEGSTLTQRLTASESEPPAAYQTVKLSGPGKSFSFKTPDGTRLSGENLPNGAVDPSIQRPNGPLINLAKDPVAFAEEYRKTGNTQDLCFNGKVVITPEGKIYESNGKDAKGNNIYGDEIKPQDVAAKLGVDTSKTLTQAPDTTTKDTTKVDVVSPNSRENTLAQLKEEQMKISEVKGQVAEARKDNDQIKNDLKSVQKATEALQDVKTSIQTTKVEAKNAPQSDTKEVGRKHR